MLILMTSMMAIMTFMHFLTVYSLCFQRLKIVFVESNKQQLSPATQKVWWNEKQQNDNSEGLQVK